MMTADEWASCADPETLLGALESPPSERRQRLFTAACARRVLAMERAVTPEVRLSFWAPPDPDGDSYTADIALFEEAVAFAESAADREPDPAAEEELETRLHHHPILYCNPGYEPSEIADPKLAPLAASEYIAMSVGDAVRRPNDLAVAARWLALAGTALRVVSAGPGDAARDLATNRARFADPVGAFEECFASGVFVGGAWRTVADPVGEANGFAVLAAHADARVLVCDIIREVFGNPFRSVAVSPAWRTPNVLALARTAYDHRAFDTLPVLADALEDTGCDSADLLVHLRSGGPHVRGCWALDLILGKS